MSHTNSTTNYGLPQFLTTDKPAWLTDVNNAYLAIDTAMKNNADAASTADGKATQAASDASAADGKATTAKNTADGAVSSIAPTFSAANTYEVGEYVMYNNILYVCVTPITTAGAWDGSYWNTVKVADVMKNNTDLITYNSYNAVNWGRYSGTINTFSSGQWNAVPNGSVRNPDSFTTITDNKITLPDDALYIAFATAKTSDGSGLVGVMITEDGIENQDSYLHTKISGQASNPYSGFRIIAGSADKKVSMKVFAQGTGITATCELNLIRVSLSRGPQS